MSDRTCCGAKCITPFCPQCGTRLQPEDPLAELLQHIRATAKGIEAELLKPRWATARKSWKDRRNIAIAKWRRWEQAVLDAIEARKEG